MQARRAVVEDKFKNGLCPTAKTFESLGDNGAARGGRLVPGQFGNGAEMPAVLIPPRAVQQQILDRVNIEPRELRCALRADAPKRSDRPLQGWRSFAATGRCGQRGLFGFRQRHCPHDTNRSLRLQRERSIRLNFNEHDLRPAIKTNRNWIPTNARSHIKWSRFCLEEAQIIFIHGVRGHYGSVKRNTYLTTMRMTGQHQVKRLVAEFLRPCRIVKQDDVFHTGLRSRRWMFWVKARNPNQVDFSSGNCPFFVHTAMPHPLPQSI